MTLAWLTKRHRLIFFVGTLIVYLVVLYTVATPHDNLSKTLVRIATATVELSLAWLLCSSLHRPSLHRQALATSLYLAIPLLVALIYTAQLYSLYLSGNFISVLAMQNSAEARIVRGGSIYLALSPGLLWYLLFVAGFVRERADSRRTVASKPSRSHNGIRVAGGIVLLCVSLVSFRAQKDNGLLAADYRQAPLLAFARNEYDAHRAIVTTHAIDAATAARFPLDKSWVYQHPLPFASAASSTELPNIIVIFTEGTSARLLGCYGGKYPGLTPNIDRLATLSMRVVNYYNHTAATYRGLQGQMVSGYPAAGGGEDSAPWETESGRKALGSIRYRSIANILGENGYHTYFISPHHDSVGLNTLLRALGFDKVFSFDDVSRDIWPGDPFYSVEGALSDGDLFTALQVLMTKKELGGTGHPFFIGIYTFGTHAFLDVMPFGKRYGDGSNSALNKLHNYDYEVGRFLDYFLASPYAKNTIFVLTADHATYPDQPFRAAAGADFKPLFVDRIPLLIYDPSHRLPAVYDAAGRTSVDLTPSLLQLLGIQEADNSFVGASLFESTPNKIGFAAIGNEFYATDSSGAYPENDIPHEHVGEFSRDKAEIETYYRLEQENRIAPLLK